MKKPLALIMSITLPLLAIESMADSTISPNEKIWLTQPGDFNKNWEGQVFHLANGYFGASCYGGVEKEVFTLAEKTFWTGGPGDQPTNDYGIIPNTPEAVEKIKQLTAEGRFAEVDQLTGQAYRSNWNGRIGNQSTVGRLNLSFNHQGAAISNYQRLLDLSQSKAFIQYEANGVEFTREYLCSYPDRVLAIRLSASKEKSLNFSVGVDLLHQRRHPQTTVTPPEGLLTIHGNIDDNNRPYVIKIKVLNDGGTVSGQGNQLQISNADAVTIFYTIATNYRPTPPLFKGADPEQITSTVINQVTQQGFDKVAAKHIADYQALYQRTKLSLANPVPERAKLPTNERLNFYMEKKDYQDLGLKELSFNFGKYILISASRPGTPVVGLQGAWNNYYHAPWMGTIQLGVNVPLTYTYGNALNLPECQMPMIDFAQQRARIGEEFAQKYYHTQGWTSFLITDIWGHAGVLDNLDLKFVSNHWLALILWEQYAFEGNEKYLKSIYPTLKGASVFFLENLIEYKNTGKLVFYSTASNEQRSAIGSIVPNYQDLGLIAELFENTAKAARILKKDHEFQEKLMKTRAKLMPFKVGHFGQFQEWVEDVDDPNCQHRHISQLLALFPASQINTRKDKKMTDAARLTLDKRGDADDSCLDEHGPNSMETPSKCTHEGYHYDRFTGQVWCRAIRLATWLRLHNPQRADKIYNDIYRESTLENMIQYETKANYSPNNQETPFFLDGTVMSAGYVTEMVLQSQNGELDLLPALPAAWHTGSIQGIRARGGFTVDISWKNGKLEKAMIRADRTSRCTIRYAGRVKTVKISKSKPYIFTGF